MSGKGMYIHIPFCKSKCKYCDFTSFVSKFDERKKYIEALEKEMDSYNISGDEIETIFIGGGTPSVLEYELLESIFKHIKEKINLDSISEYTVECNPGTLSYEKLKLMKENGVNRLSIGLQAIQETHLEFMGRTHTLDEFIESFNLARRVGFKNINIDLIFAFYGQTLTDWEKTLDYIINLEPEHISAYSLIIEEGTVFWEKFINEEIKEIDEEKYIEMYRTTVSKLKDSGYSQYEISNYSKKGKQCLHNLCYWDGREYYGFGLGASGYIGNIRYTNTTSMAEYIKKIDGGKKPVEFYERLKFLDVYNEKIMLGLRKNSGIKYSDLTLGLDITSEKKLKRLISECVKKGYIIVENDNIALTQKGREVSNSIIVDFML